MFASLYGASHGRTVGFRRLPMPLSPGAISAAAAVAAVDDPFVRDMLLALVRRWLAADGTTHELIDGVFHAAEVLSVLTTQLPAEEIAPIAALAPAVDAFLARFPSQPWPHPLREHADYWRRLAMG